MSRSTEDLMVPRAALPAAAFDVLIIGSGMGGLSSALLLAKEGFRVCVLEQHYRPGGCLHRFFRDGVPFDTGFHYLGGAEDGTFSRYLRYLGVHRQLRFHPLDEDGFDVLRFPEITFSVPASWKRLVARLRETFPHEHDAIKQYAAACQAICRDAPAYSFQKPTGAADRFAGVALGPFLRSLTDDPLLRAVLAGQSLLYGIEPEQTPLELHALVIDSMLQGPAGLDGGGDALAKVMVQAIQAAGGVVRIRAKVRGLEVQNSRVTAAVLESGEVVHARCVISNAHPKATLRLLPAGAMRPAYVHRVEGMKEGISCIGGYFTHDDPSPPSRRHNLYLYPSSNLDEAYYRSGFGSGQNGKKGLFVTFPSDRENAWKGPRVVLALGMMPYSEVAAFAESATGKRGDEYQQLKARHGSDLLAAVEEGIPELAGKLQTVEISTPLSNRDYTGAQEGAIYGLRHSMDQWGRYALHPRTRIPNLLLTGQSIIMPGVVGVTVGAFVTCGFLLGFDSLFAKVARA